MKKKILLFIPYLIAITFIFGFAYVVVQQNYRMSANDPQIQIAEDTAQAIQNGEDATNLVAQNKIDVSKSLSSFSIVYDKNKKPFLGSALLEGKLPSLPDGTFEAAKEGENRFTWEPKEGVRIAAVLVAADKGNKGYVLAGRSLLEVEKRISDLTLMAEIAWAVTCAAVFGWFLLREKLLPWLR
jgi:hypothetical protein